MKRFARHLFMPLLATLAAVGCTPPEGPGGDTGNSGDDPKIPVIEFTAGPDAAEMGEEFQVVALVTIAEGEIASVTLHYGTDGEKAMTATANPEEYSATLTAPAEEGAVLEYWIEAESAAGKSAKSNPLSLVAVKPGTEIQNPAEKLRLSEISTYGTNKFIEIYNPTGSSVSLAGVSIWKNGELLHTFAATDALSSQRYGVLKAKEASFSVPPSTGKLLGSTDVGLSGSKSLSVELRFEGTVIDAFANTRNPGVGAMTVSDWDGEVELSSIELSDFFRKAPATDGWWGIGPNSGGTPGRAPSSADETFANEKNTRLKHQLLTADAVADYPYFANVTVNPIASGEVRGKGLTPSDNVIRFNAYTDPLSGDISVQCTVDGQSVPATNIEGSLYEIRPTLASGSTAGTRADLAISVTNAVGTYPAPGAPAIPLLVFPASQTFGSYSDICLNELQMNGGDAIELWNRTDNPVAIGGMRIRKDKDRIFTVPGYMVLKGKGFAVLGCDDDVPAASTSYLVLGTVSNGLSGDKPLLIELRRPKFEPDPDGNNGVNIDSFVNTNVVNPNKDNWDNGGRALVEQLILSADGERGAGHGSDGSANWYVLTKISIGSSNSGGGTTTTTKAFTHRYTGGGDE